MSHVSTEEKHQGNDWRVALPAQWPPLWIYLAIMVALLFTGNIDQPRYNQPFGQGLGAFYWIGFAVFVALLAMLRLQIRYRLIALLLIELFRLNIRGLVTATDQYNLATMPDLIRAVGNQLAIDVVYFAFISTVAHGAASLFGAHVTAKSDNQLTQENGHLANGSHATIAEWLYFISIVGFIFLPQPKGALNASSMTWEPFNWFNFQRLVVGPQYVLIISLLGLFCLSHPRRGWRFSLLILVLIGILAIAPLATIFYRFRRAMVPWGLVNNFIMTLQSVPYWLLLRWAGYRLVSPRRWIDPPPTEIKELTTGTGD